MSDTILLINPNTWQEPPVIPVGLEYVGTSLKLAGYKVEILDMCFEADPAGVAAEAVRAIQPLFVGITIRNIDSVIFENNVFFIPDIAKITQAVKNEGAKTLLGGAGFSGMPEYVLEATGADYGIAGPSEKAIVQFAAALASGANPPRLTNGWLAGIDPEFTPIRPFKIDYDRYISNRGVVGFATQYGCPEKCEYCIESQTPVLHRSPAAVVAEISSLAALGFRELHLCDCEFNLNLDFSERFARELAGAELGISWAVYMKPIPFSDELFRQLKKSGAAAVTLSVDSSALSSPHSRYNADDVLKFMNMCKSNELKLAVDLLSGLPDEPLESTKSALDFFRANRPDSVGIISHIRIYPGIMLERLSKRADLTRFMLRPSSKDPLAPMFYNHIPTDKLRELVAGDSLFKIEGFENSSNYERLR